MGHKSDADYESIVEKQNLTSLFQLSIFCVEEESLMTASIVAYGGRILCWNIAELLRSSFVLVLCYSAIFQWCWFASTILVMCAEKPVLILISLFLPYWHFAVLYKVIICGSSPTRKHFNSIIWLRILFSL